MPKIVGPIQVTGPASMVNQTRRQECVRAHHLLKARDRAYAESPTPDNNRALILAQRTYYIAYARHVALAHTPQEARTRRVNAIRQRARLNRQRERYNEEWQQLALHQVQRATILVMRCKALNEYELSATTEG